MSLYKILFSIAIISLVVSRVWAAPISVPPEARKFTLGEFTIFALRDSRYVLPNDGNILGKGAGSAKVSEVLKKANVPTDKITFDVDVLLVKTSDRAVLLDTGFGPKRGGVLMRSLALTGTSPEQVTDILITHGHNDHIGGLLNRQGKPAFQKATIYIPSTEWTWFKSKPGNKRYIDALQNSVKTFEPGSMIMPGFRAIAIAGHTPGHTGYEITSDESKLLDIGDTAHSSVISLGHPEWINGFDNNAAQSRLSREQLLGRLADSQELIFAPHFPFPGIGTIGKAETGYVWKPTTQSNK